MKIKKAWVLSIIVAVVFGITCLLYFTGILDWSENKAYDHRISFTSKFIDTSDEITVVLLDQESLNWAKEEFGWGWPWPREAYAKMLDFFNEGNASSVALDMVYTEPSVYGNEDDEKFAEASKRFGRMIQTVFYSTHDPNEIPTFPIPLLKDSAGIIGTVQSDLDSDGVARRNRLYSTSVYKEPSLAIASLLVSDTMPELSSIPLSKKGGMYIRFQKDLDRYVPYNARQIIESQIAYENGEEGDLVPSDFENQYVFFGVFAPGLFDVCSTPVSAKTPGVGIHICQMDTILNQNYLRDLPFLLEMFIILLFAALGGIIGEISNNGKTSSIIKRICYLLVTTIIYVILNYFIFYKGYILPFTAPILAFLLSFISCVVKNYFTEGRQRIYLKHAFGQYLSPTVIDNLIEHPEALKLGGEKREISVYFSDVQGFTSISENLSPEELTDLLNKYLSAMTDIILAHGGTIDKYEGDAIIAFWNAPTFQEDHAKRALEAALECQQKLKEMQAELVPKAGKPVLQRIGLNTGYAVVGNMGSSKRFDYTMLGDTVNLASRLEGINKQFGTYTMCSKATMEKAIEHGCNFKFRELADIAVVGRKEGVFVYEPMLQNEYENRSADFENFASGLELFTSGKFEEAKKTFQKTSGVDPAASKYIEKCDLLINNPPENWDGVLRATEK